MRKEVIFLAIVFFTVLVSAQSSDSDLSRGVRSGVLYDGASDSIGLNGTVLSGYFESEIIDAGEVVVWKTLSFEASDFGELPDGEEPLFVVTAGVGLEAMVLLMHMNDDIVGSGLGIDDDSGFLHDGVSAGSLNCSVGGTLDLGCGFFGSESIEVVGTSSLALVNNFTHGFWILPGATDGEILDRGGYVLFYNSSTQSVEVVANGSLVASTPSGSVSSGSWSHVAVVFSSNGLTAYVNGQSVVNDSFSDDVIVTGFEIGDGFVGTLDEFAMWSGELNASTVHGLYVRGVTSYEFSVRSCGDSACSGIPFVVIDGRSPVDLSVFDLHYFSYRVDLLTEDLLVSPRVFGVSAEYEFIIEEATGGGSSSDGSSGGGSFDGAGEVDEGIAQGSPTEEPESGGTEEVEDEVVLEPRRGLTGFLGLDFEESTGSFVGFVLFIGVVLFLVMWFTYSKIIA